MKTGTIFTSASRLFALIPGIGIMIKNIGLPPGISNVLFGAIVETFGVFTILIFFIYQSKIAAINDKKITRLSTTFICGFSFFLFLYLLFFNTQLVYNSQYDLQVFFPFWYSPDLANLIKVAGDKNAAITMFGPQAIRNVILQAPGYLVATKIIMSVIYFLIFEFLVLGFALIGFKLSKTKLT